MTTERIGWQDIPALRDAKDWIDGLGVDPVVTYRKDQVVRLIDRLLRQAEADIPPLPTKVPLALSSHDGEDMRVVFAQPDSDRLTLWRSGAGETGLRLSAYHHRLTPMVPTASRDDIEEACQEQGSAVVVQRPETLNPSVWNRDSLIQMARTLMFGGRTSVQTIARSAAVVRAVADAMPREEES